MFSNSCLSLRPRFIGGSNLMLILRIAELVPSVSEESRSEFASATPRNRYTPRNDRRCRDRFLNLSEPWTDLKVCPYGC